MSTTITKLLVAFFVAVAGTLVEAAERPNIMVIMTDDLGFSDIGCYGSEIETPNLDRLARNGLRFSQFYNTAKCHSSRISLLTGQYALQAGDTQMNRAVTSAEVLRESGYSTAMVGKWHLDKEPTDFGFERYFGHLSGACNYFRGDDTFRLNGQKWSVPPAGFYTTVADVDFAIQFLNEARQAEKPWYLYVAFNAPHAPLQPLEVDYEKYEGRYDDGWDVIREARATSQNDLELFGQDVVPSPRPDHVPSWSSLSDGQRDWESRRMTALAGMIDRVDQEIGRLLADVESAGELENTFVLFVSDNGACPYDRRSIGGNREPYQADTMWSDSTGWAWARNTPFRFYKQNQFEGGIATPGIVHWPTGLKTKPGSINHDPVHLIDVLPTIAELAHATIPDHWPDRQLKSVSGISFAKILNGQPLGARPPIHFLFAKDRGLRDGDWKLASFQSSAWELYNLSTDRTELHDLSKSNPEIRVRMIQRWHEIAEEVLEVPPNARKPVSNVTAKEHREWTNFDKEVTEPLKKKRHPEPNSIRARIDTQLAAEGEQLVLTCSGADSGLAIDRLALPNDSVGPFSLRFQLQSDASGSGEIYFVTDPKTKLPNGEHLEFDVNHDGQWHQHIFKFDTPKILHGLRIDPCSGTGTVRIQSLQLIDANGTIISRWPQTNN